MTVSCDVQVRTTLRLSHSAYCESGFQLPPRYPDCIYYTPPHLYAFGSPVKTTRLVDVAQAGNNSDNKKWTAQMVMGKTY